MCNNILELACNPSTVFNVTELHSDPTYDVTDKFPDWMKRQIKRQERINKILRWYQDLHWGWKLGVGIALLIGAIGFTVATGGGGAGVISVLVQTAIGVGVGIGLYTAGSLLMGTFTWEGLADAALNAFLITSATVFISSAVNYIKYACRSKPVSTAELKAQVGEDIVGTKYNEIKPTQDYVNRETVNEYIMRINKGESLNPIQVSQTSKGLYIIDGHHRFVASQMTNTSIGMNITKGGPIGFPDWSFVKWI